MAQGIGCLGLSPGQSVIIAKHASAADKTVLVRLLDAINGELYRFIFELLEFVVMLLSFIKQ